MMSSIALLTLAPTMSNTNITQDVVNNFFKFFMILTSISLLHKMEIFFHEKQKGEINESPLPVAVNVW